MGGWSSPIIQAHLTVSWSQVRVSQSESSVAILTPPHSPPLFPLVPEDKAAEDQGDDQHDPQQGEAQANNAKYPQLSHSYGVENICDISSMIGTQVPLIMHSTQEH